MSTAKNKVLGRGLSAILGDNESTKFQSKIDEINIDEIFVNPDQPRKYFDREKLEELTNSIKENGIIQPITVKKIDNNKFLLISGERRLRASKNASLITIPAYIREINDNQLLELALVENIQRSNLNPLEIAFSYKRLVDECGYTQEIIATKVSKKRSTITNFLRILNLPLDIQIALKEEKISMGHAKALMGLEKQNMQLNLLKKIINNNLSVRKVEEIIKNLNTPKKLNNEKFEEDFLKYTIKLKETLSSKLNKKVNIKALTDEKGEIRITFNSKKELEEIVKSIS